MQPSTVQTDGGTSVETEETAVPAEIPITLRIMFSAAIGGFVGTVAMIPVLIGAPILLGVFQTEPILDFAEMGMVFGIESTLLIGIALFFAAGTIVLPLLFVVTGGFLPPRSPGYLRGVTFASMMWAGFLIAFWPDGGARTTGLFLGVSLLGHWIYGMTLAGTVERYATIPEHDV